MSIALLRRVNLTRQNGFPLMFTMAHLSAMSFNSLGGLMIRSYRYKVTNTDGSGSVTTYGRFTARDFRQRFQNPKHVWQIPSGMDASTFYERTYDNAPTGTFSGGLHYIDHSTGRVYGARTSSGSVGMALDTPHLVVRAYDNIAVARCSIDFFSSARELLNSFQAGTFLGELRDTISMVTRPGRAVQRAFERYMNKAYKVARPARYAHKRGWTKEKVKKYIRNAERKLLNYWLTFQLGIKPLLSDIDAGMKALALAQVKPPSAPCQGEYSENLGYVRYPDQGHSGGSLKIFSHDSVSVRAVGSVKYDQSPNTFAGVDKLSAQQFGLDLASFVPTLWNLVPFSFVVDYFTNLGDFIAASSSVTTKFVFKNTLFKRVRNTYFQGQAGLSYPPNPQIGLDGRSSWFSGSGHYNGEYFVRTTTVATPSIAGLNFRIPGVSQLLNVGALIRVLSQGKH